MLFTNKHPVHVAALIDAVVGDRALQDRIIDGQYAALDRLEARDFGSTLLSFVDQVLAAPRRPPPPVAFDFWDQLKLREELEELWVHRPAAFKALPFEADAGPGAGTREPDKRSSDPGSRIRIPMDQR